MNSYHLFFFTERINNALFTCCGFNQVHLGLIIKPPALNRRYL